jgi:hypothetical protein
MFPVQLQQQQQHAFEQLLLLPQLLSKLLGSRPKLWLQGEQYCNCIRSVLQAFHHTCGTANINHAADVSAMPMVGTLAQQWLGMPLLSSLASAMQDMAQLLSRH